MEMVEQKDLVISEKNATVKTYLDKIVSWTMSHFAIYVELTLGVC